MSTAPQIYVLKSQQWKDTTPVLEGGALRRAVAIGLPTPKFGDGVWNLNALQFRENAIEGHGILDFDNLFPDPVRHLTARELVMQRLNLPVAPIRRKARLKRMSLQTVAPLLYDLRQLYTFMDDMGIARLDDLTQDHFDAFARRLQTHNVKPGHIADSLSVLVYLYEARHLLTADRIVVLPWNGRSPYKVLKIKRQRENLTPRIPEEVMSPLLRWARTYVNLFANDIITAHDTNDDRRRLTSGKVSKTKDPRPVRIRLADYLESLKRQGKKLPCDPRYGALPHRRAIQAAVGASSYCIFERNRDMIDAAVRELGLDNGSFDTPISNIPGTDRPWRSKFRGSEDVFGECRHLIAACYIICAYLSGMRDSEVQAMRHDCHEVLRDADGNIVRQYVRSREYKGRGPEGVERTWIVIDEVAQAIKVMQALGRRARAAYKDDLLFVLLEQGRVRGRPSLKRLPNVYIAEFINHVNSVLAPTLAVPDHSNIPIETFTPITTRMFRRTIAWHIANRPFGVVAGMIQYGHVSVTMFEGYAGSSDSGFRQEVEAEREMARKHDIVEMYEDFKRGIAPAGPMGAELADEFQQLQEQLSDYPDFPGKIIDEDRRDRMLRHLRTRLYPGLMADCFFEPKNARCVSHLKVGDRREPISGICDPHCENACWLKKHLPVWRHALTDVERLAKRNRISPIQRDILNRKRAAYRSVIASLEEVSNARAKKAR